MRNMRNGRSKTGSARLIPAHTETQEFRKGEKGVVFCSNCGIVYYKKSWHHNLRYFASFEKDQRVVFRLCPACTMIKNRQFEGRVIVRHVPEKYRTDLEHLMVNFARRAYERDPLDRLIELKKSRDEFTATLTENELAQKLGKKIKEVFRAKVVKISHSPRPSDVTYVTVDFA